MYVNVYIEKGLYLKNLFRVLEDGGILIFVFVFWNMCGVFIFVIFGVGVFEYVFYVILNFIVFIILIIYGIIGFIIVKLLDIEKVELLKK